MKKRVLSLILVLALMLCTFSVPASAVTAYDLWVGGVQVTSENAADITAAINAAGGTAAGTASYENGILTLADFSYTGAGYNPTGDRWYAIYTAGTDINISVTGTNNIILHKSSTGTNDFVTGLYAADVWNVNISGTGSLLIKAEKVDQKKYVYGARIGEDSTLTIDGADVKFIAETDASSYSRGIFMYEGGKITVKNGGTLECSGGNSAVYANESTDLDCGDSYNVYAGSSADGTGAATVTSRELQGMSAYKYLRVEDSTFKVTVTPGAHMTLSSGSESQTGLTGAMTDVVYTADEGYYFPTDYVSAIASTSVTITRNNDIQLTISGTPTANERIVLPAATSLAVSHTHEGWTAWSTTNALPTAAGNYYLTVDVTVSGIQHNAWSAPAGVTRICLEGHTINWYNSKYPGYNRNIMRVHTGSELHIYDKDDNSGKITGGAATWMASGYPAYFGNGGGVYVEGGTFYLHGGQITGNGAVAGGGVSVCQNGRFYMSGGVISNNSADDTNWFRAAGVQVESGGVFTMTGGVITGNVGPYNARRWGVFVNGEATINISGSPVITGNQGEYNLLLGDGRKINVIGPLTEDARIGVSTWNRVSETENNPTKITAGLSGNGALSNFICNNGERFTDPPANNAIRLSGGDVEVYYAPPHDVAVTPGANMTKTTDSGAESQTGLTGAMTDVVYTADEGYYFPTDYTVASVNGIGVTRDSYTQITVSGTPTDDAAVVLTAPTAKTAEDTPEAVFNATGEDGGTLGSVTAGMKYSIDGGATWNDVTGTSIDLTGVTAENGVQIKLPATDADTRADSAVQTIAVTKADAPTAPTSADCSGTANNDGRLIGVTAAMEYKKSDAATWTVGTGSDLTGLVPGTYCVRVQASGTALASDPRYLTISPYVAIETVETPVLPDDGTFTESMSVTITCATDGAEIYYTTDGSYPSTNGTLYGAPFTVSETVTVKAIALKAGMADSEVASATYTLAPADAEEPPAEDEPAETSFTDVAEDTYYYDAVQWAVENGITAGTSETTFSPNAACSRAQMMTFLWRAAGKPEPTVANPFIDLDESAYYYKAVLWAYENGITFGTGGGKFSPDDDVSRAQGVTFLFRAFGSKSGAEMPFADVPKNAYYYEAVLWAAENGVTSGTGDSTFSPEDDCLRAQAVTFLYRVYAAE